MNKDPERTDTTKRTGVHIVIRDSSISYIENQEYHIQVESPSMKDTVNAMKNILFMEEYGTPTSADLAYKEKYVVAREMAESEISQLQGAITYFDEEKDIHLCVSISGMKPNENVAIAVIVTAEVLELPISDILEFIMYFHRKDPDEGNFPSDEVFYHLIQQYQAK